MMNRQIFEAVYNGTTDTHVTIKLNGHVRTVVNPPLAFPEGSAYTLEYNREYDMCWMPQEWEGGEASLLLCFAVMPLESNPTYNSFRYHLTQDGSSFE